MAWEGAVTDYLPGKLDGNCSCWCLVCSCLLGEEGFFFSELMEEKGCKRRKSHLKVSMSDPGLSARNMAPGRTFKWILRDAEEFGEEFFFSSCF